MHTLISIVIVLLILSIAIYLVARLPFVDAKVKPAIELALVGFVLIYLVAVVMGWAPIARFE